MTGRCAVCSAIRPLDELIEVTEVRRVRRVSLVCRPTINPGCLRYGVGSVQRHRIALAHTPARRSSALPIGRAPAIQQPAIAGDTRR